MKYVVIPTFAAIVFASCGSNTASTQHPSAKYEEKKASMEEMERDSPLKFLKVSGSSHGNLVNQTVVEGEIRNKATLITYKNIQLQITFLDKEGSVIEKQKESLDVEVKPGESEDFKIKTGHVKGTNSVTFDIVSATADK